MKKLCSVLVVLMLGGAMEQAWAGGGCRVVQPCAPQVIYVPVQQVIYMSPYVPTHEPVRACNPRRPSARGIVYAPRVMAQPGYWVQRETSCGKVQRVGHPSQRVTVSSYPGSRFVRASW